MFRYLAVAAILTAGTPLLAATNVYTSSTSFNDVTTTAAFVDFEDEAEGSRGLSWTTGGMTIEILPGAHANRYLYVTPSGTTGTPGAPDSTTLVANGDENFLLRLSNGAGFNAIGFDLLTNSYGAPVVSLYDGAGQLIEAVTVQQAPTTFGFFGLTSTTTIAYATFIVDRGWVENAAIDNVRIGNVAPVPEPTEWTMMISGLAVAGCVARRRTRVRRGR